MNIKETRKKYIALYKKVHGECLERIKQNPAISEIVWEGFVVHLMVRDFLTHIKDLEAENEANEEIKNELIDSINKNGERIQELMKKTNRKWEYHYDMTESDGDVFYITDKNTNVSLTDQSIVNFMAELEAENERLREAHRSCHVESRNGYPCVCSEDDEDCPLSKDKK